jgi:hypothetical protein
MSQDEKLQGYEASHHFLDWRSNLSSGYLCFDQICLNYSDIHKGWISKLKYVEIVFHKIYSKYNQQRVSIVVSRVAQC